MENNNTNWCQSVAGVVIKNGKVLLARHTYGNGKGLLITPGGYVEYGESPVDAVKREFMEETSVQVEPEKIIGIRFNAKDWYVVFSAKYISGTPTSDNDENSEVLWVDVDDALRREDVAEFTKSLIRCTMSDKNGLTNLPYNGRTQNGKSYFFGVAQ